MTHDELIKRAFLWLKNTKRCSVVVSELVSESEIPDVIGWNGKASILVEAKVSVADFNADQFKSFRRYPDNGMGAYRYYIATPEIAQKIIGKLPEKWGLLVCKNGRIQVLKKSEGFETNLYKEMGILLSLIKRISKTDKPVDGVGVKRYIEALAPSNPKAVYYASQEG